jgi:hypothetical protein
MIASHVANGSANARNDHVVGAAADDEATRLEEAYAKSTTEAIGQLLSEMGRIAGNPKLMTPELDAALDDADTLKNR